MTTELYTTVDGFLAGLAASGVRDVIASPGLRSTPLVVSADRRPDLSVRIVLDERAAAFMALGMAKASGRAVGLICTSGTAGANYYPAVIEARLTRVPLVVLTADRPPELAGWDAGQTVDQVKLYGDHAKDFVAMPVGPLHPARAERIGFRVGVTAADGPAGPVHVNWPFREPFEPDLAWCGEEPARSELEAVAAAPSVVPEAAVDLLAELAQTREGMVAVGPLDAVAPGAATDGAAPSVGTIQRFAEMLGWPIVADPLSQLRAPIHPNVLSNGDHLFRVADWADARRARVVVRIGAMPTSKAFRMWMERTRPGRVVLIDPHRRWSDPSAVYSDIVHADPLALLAAVCDRLDAADDLDEPGRPLGRGTVYARWFDTWAAADDAAAGSVEAVLATSAMCEPAATRAVVDALDHGSILWAASSMPIRNLDGFMGASAGRLRVMANRGANGIDGTIASAAGALLGAANPGAPKPSGVLLIGDLAFLYDLGGLRAAAESEANLTIVVLDNNGGGIFSMLPIAEGSDTINFETLYRTPHNSSLAAAARMVDVDAETVRDPAGLQAAVRAGQAGGGLNVVVVPVDRDANVAQFRTIARRVAEALP